MNQASTGVTRLEQAATAGVIALATGSFVLSYDALHHLAESNQVPRPLAWIWPLIVDGFIITASLAVLHAVLRGRSARYPWVLVLGFSTMSVAFNVLQARPTGIARLVAAIPPLALVLSFELLMRQLRDRLTLPASEGTLHNGVVDTACSAEQPETNETARVASTSGRSVLQRAREIHEQHVRDGTKPTGKTLGELLGVSDGYARRLLREIGAASG